METAGIQGRFFVCLLWILGCRVSLTEIIISFNLIFLSCFPFVRLLSMSADAKVARIASLENMVGMSSAALKAMTSQLTEAEERERALNNRGRWNHLRSMGEAKNVLQFLFNSTAEARCSLASKNLIKLF